MAFENLNNQNKEFQSLQKSFQNWDAGLPSSDVWEDLEADLAVSAVWDRLDESLEANGSPADKPLVESYENWSPNNSGNGWSKLEEQLSRERVWTRLNTTLSYPISTSLPWMKMTAASLVFIFVSFYTDRFTLSDSQKMKLTSSELSGFENHSTSLKSNEVNGTNWSVNQNLPNDISTELDRNNLKEKRINKESKFIANRTKTGVNNQLVSKEIAFNEKQNLNNNSVSEKTLLDSSNHSDSNFEDIADLGRKEITLDPKTMSDFSFLPPKFDFKPRFSVQVGGQFSFINENNRTAFSSSLPRIGIAADFQYHLYAKNIRFTQDFGFSQYAQSNGSYVNGRYRNSNQRLNTVYFMSSVGYTFKGVTVYGGVTVNRLLSGYEESRTAITNVYNSKKLQVGAAAGIDYHFTPFKNKTALGVGLQYQFLSQLKSGNALFEDIHGVKLQLKYSF
ncbi:hypothetical protein [Fluviicola taffensis]|uniref:Outer membrane protein beta-barrel domain-containing protein n=1 Tax=Fluviicola taffensis (strain DSM 16823 / NCIMB 13979 / RW262) TaxID=755732 RepID=F2I9B0_FLUTR|nr:hypothetical protein [Fluviicola taffensis]AEA44067.1 hypothetical protein Fluta_2081 [Fluviicola taffensis DSM 16823]